MRPEMGAHQYHFLICRFLTLSLKLIVLEKDLLSLQYVGTKAFPFLFELYWYNSR